MKASVLARLSCLALLALGQSSCSSDSGAAGGTSLDGKKLADLTPAERAEFCSANRDAFAAVEVGSCTLSGLDAPTKADCEMAQTECRASSVTSGAVCQDADAGPPDLSECGALRVMQVQSCLSETRTYFSSLTCDSFAQEPPAAPSCLATLAEDCPVLVTGA